MDTNESRLVVRYVVQDAIGGRRLSNVRKQEFCSQGKSEILYTDENEAREVAARLIPYTGRALFVEKVVITLAPSFLDAL